MNHLIVLPIMLFILQNVIDRNGEPVGVMKITTTY